MERCIFSLLCVHVRNTYTATGLILHFPCECRLATSVYFVWRVKNDEMDVLIPNTARPSFSVYSSSLSHSLQEFSIFLSNHNPLWFILCHDGKQNEGKENKTSICGGGGGFFSFLELYDELVRIIISPLALSFRLLWSYVFISGDRDKFCDRHTHTLSLNYHLSSIL